jgi:Ca2+-binding EF-hand superfamily protein
MGITLRDLAELRAHFKFCDRDGDQRLSYEEFVELLENLDAGMSDEEMRLGFGLIDLDHNGSVSFQEFQHWWLEDLA